MELPAYPWMVLLHLVIVPQIAAHETSCNGTQYVDDELNRCCNRCPPGHYVKEECTPSSETVCQPCGPKTYATQWNWAKKCRRCYGCSGHLVERQPCTATQATVCGCPDGYSCNRSDALNVCVICVPPPPTVPTDTTVPGTADPPADMKNIWIIVGGLLFMVTAIVVIICLKRQLLKSFGRMIKEKSCSESTPQPETGEDSAVVRIVNGGPAFPLLKNGPIKMPSQEEGKELHFPVQVSDGNEVGEISLLAK